MYLLVYFGIGAWALKRNPICLAFWITVFGLISGHSSLLADDDFDPTSQEALRSGAPDPAIIECHDGSGFYVFSTGHGVRVWHSTDLKKWKQIAPVFKSHVPQWAEQAVPGCDGIWAPEIQRCNGLYYLYYSVSTFGSQRSVIGLAVNKTINPQSPDFKWIDRGLVIESNEKTNDFNAIDPAMFRDEDGRAYLYWGSYWTGIKGVEIDSSTGKPFPNGKPYVALATRSERKDPPNIEAPYVIKHNDFYYLMVSWDFCCAGEGSSYKVVVGRSRNPLGPFVGKDGKPMTKGGGTIVLSSNTRWRGPGHNSFLQTDSGDYMVHHVYDAQDVQRGRILQVRKVHWTADGWFKVDRPITDFSNKARSKMQMSPLVGRWDHVVNGKDHYDIFFEVTGELTGTAGDARWLRKSKSALTLRWLDPNAPNGAWVDEVQLSADGKRYFGKNQNGVTIEGKRVPN